MLYTQKYKLNKPEPSIDNVNIDVINNNMDVIDKGLVIYLGTTAGSGNAFTAISDDITALIEGLAVSVKFHEAASGASTLNINGFGAIAIKKAGGANVTNIKSGIYTLRYDGTNFILQGEGASGNALASDLTLGKTATTDVGEITGTMPVNGPEEAETINLTSQNQEYTIAAGRHSGLRKIKAALSNLAAGVIKAGTTVGGILGTYTSDANATEVDILSGKSAYVNGEKKNGSMPNRSGVANNSLSHSGSSGNIYLTPPAGFYDGLTGTSVRAQDADFIANNIKAGTEIFGLTGTFTSSGNIVAGDVRSGKIGFANAQIITGNLAEKGAETFTPSTSNQTIPANRILTGVQTILGDADLIPANIKSGINIFGVVGTLAVGKKYAEGSMMSGTVSMGVYNMISGTSHSRPYITVTGLTFKPSFIIISYETASHVIEVTYIGAMNAVYFMSYSKSDGQVAGFAYNALIGSISVTSTGFTLPVGNASWTVNWYAFE